MEGPTERFDVERFERPVYGRLRREAKGSTRAGPWHHVILKLYEPDSPSGTVARAFGMLCKRVFYERDMELIDLVPVGEWCGGCGMQERGMAPRNPEATDAMFGDRSGQCRRTVELPAQPGGDPVYALCPRPAVRDRTCADHLGEGGGVAH